MEILQLPVLTDNYIYLIHDALSGDTAVVDPALAGPVLDTLKEKGWRLTHILNTHHHFDHVGGNLQLKEATGCRIYASRSDRQRIPGIDVCLAEGDSIHLGQNQATILETPGHTLGHIVYYFAEQAALFCGDTLFVMGCGRLFEGSAEQMWQSLAKLKQLPAHCKVYCAHEYTQNNGRFALTVDPDNTALQTLMRQIDQERSQNRPTVPSTLKQELATNPFLRADQPDIQNRLNMSGKQPVEVFAKIRSLKDRF